MNRNSLLAAAAALAAAALSACGGSSMSSLTAPATAAPPTSTAPAAGASMTLDTASLLEQARKSSETASPLPVDGGALKFDDTSDTTEALSVDGS